MEGLIRLQIHIRNNVLKSYRNFQMNPERRDEHAYITVKLECLEKTWERFENNHYELLKMKELPDDCEYLTERVYDEAVEVFFQYKTALRECISNSRNIRDEPLRSVQLPKINLPIFSGKYVEWTSFHDLFEAVIHGNTNLSKVEKLYYLKAHITGDAEQLLRHVPITEENYERSWELLKRRYSNRRYIANNILKRLFEQESLLVESSNGLKDLLDTTNECLYALSNLGLDISGWDILIIHIVTQKFDESSRREWEQKISETVENFPTFMELTKFLEDKFRMLEILELGKKELKLELGEKERESKVRQIQRTQVFHLLTSECPFCKESHMLEQCQKFRQIELRSRLEFIDKNRLCFNCLGSYHRVSRCKRINGCERCHRRHHTLLHREKRQSSSQGLGFTGQAQTYIKGNCNAAHGTSKLTTSSSVNVCGRVSDSTSCTQRVLNVSSRNELVSKQFYKLEKFIRRESIM